MDKNKKKIFTYATIIVILLMPFLIFNYSHADAGWDTDYNTPPGGSGGSGGGGSNGGSGGSSRSSDSGWNDSGYRGGSSYYSHGNSGPYHPDFRTVFGILSTIIFGIGTVILIFPDTADSLDGKSSDIYSVLRVIELIAAPILFIIYPFYCLTTDELGSFDYLFAIYNVYVLFQIPLFKRFSSDYKKKEIELDLDDDYYDITPERLSMFLPGYSLTGLKNELYNRFINIQNAWMNFDYDALRELCTDELFNTYKSQLQVLKAKNGKNVMNGFFPKKINIYDVRASDGIISVKVYLKVSFFDYVVNTTSKKVTQGKRFKRITNHYEMVFVKSVMDNTVTRCPNCNASINFVTSGECPYCGSTIVVPPNQLVLSKKTNLLTK